MYDRLLFIIKKDDRSLGYANAEENPVTTADEVCRVMAGNEMPTCVTDRDTPIPVTAFEILQRKAGGAVMITRSHNATEWNSIKYIPDHAGPAMPEITEEITRNIDRVRASVVNESMIQNGFERHLLEEIDATTSYIEFVENSINTETCF